MMIIRWFALIICFYAFLSGPAICADTTSNTLELSRNLAEIVDVKNTLMDHISLTFPPKHREIVKVVFSEEEEIWKVVNEDVSRMYSELYSQEELKELINFFNSKTGKKWLVSQKDFSKKSFGKMQKNESYLKQISILGCSTNIFTNQLERYVNSKGGTTDDITIDFIKGSMPVFPSYKRFCTCILDEGAKIFGNDFILYQHRYISDFQKLTGQLVENGTCKLPGS